MSDDEFDEEPELDEEDLDEDSLAEDEDFDEDSDDALIDDDDAEIDDEAGEEEEAAAAATVPLTEVDTEEEEELAEEDDDIVDLDEELHPDDVEEALDVVLRERTAKVGLEDEEEDEDEPDDRGEGGTRIVPRRENEFLCKSCFLVLPRHQLADEERMLCRDCA
jgi:hypothetical protein